MGGNEILARDIIAELRIKGHEVYLLTGHGQNFSQSPYHLFAIDFELDRMAERFSGVRKPALHESFRWHIFDPVTYRKIKQTLNEIKPDLAIVDNFSLISTAPLLAAVQAGSKVLVQANDKWLIYGLKKPGQGLWHCPPPQKPIIAAIQTGLQPIFNLMARNVSIVVNSHFLKSVYLRAGFKADQLKVVHLGIDVEVYTPHTARFHLADPVRLLFASQLWEGKGPQVAVKALAELKKQAPEQAFILNLYGHGAPEFINYLNNLAKELDVYDSIQYCGFVPASELTHAFHSHDIFMFNSIWDEPFSLTLLSAMSCGIPTISTSVGGNPEAIEHGRTGLIVPPNDPVALAQAVLELVQNPELRVELSLKASDAVRQKWSFKHYVDSLEELYRTYAEK